ncbi:Piso0_004956 [Millerozyma farinosa CBS 7064]|uniref:Piso0_004956 protein n=1 Tax=Pichia sorbitophila (strain ATCC MYA-4447 / BCRC 22081 / CBS 7064 / NBRC 10061 / NRRL Y-12695) TaxID=559304 RepID=G8Y3U8_PICSO|nr:Piso0_004956 [Millerozyma farinosa CBS 7064]
MERHKSNHSNHKVVIIGAGMAGIKCAIDLAKNGVEDTIILEASDRIGGRLETLKTPDGLVCDLGASWFHDSLTNPIFNKVLDDKRIKYFVDDKENLFYSENEAKIDQWRFREVLEEIMAYGEVHGIGSEKDYSVAGLCSMYDANRGRFTADDRKQLAFGAMRQLAELWNGTHWDNISAKYCFEGLGHTGRNMLLTSGYESVLREEIGELPPNYEAGKIKLNSRVSAINYEDTDKVKVESENGHVYVCDYVVVTVPHTILKLSDPKDPCYLQWEPPLPPTFAAGLSKTEYGSLGKVVFEFDACFWHENIGRFYALATKEPSNMDLPQPWEYPIIFLNYQLISNKPALVALTQEPLSTYLESLVTSKEVEIWRLFEPLISKISHVSPTPRPKRIYNSSWRSKKHIRGTYAYPARGKGDPEAIITLLEKSFDTRIRFAGAESVRGSANGCVHGAWMSGSREAQFILSYLK